MEHLSKSQLTSLYEECLKLVKKKPAGFIIFTKLKIHGWCIYDEDIIEVDYRKDFARTLYHECVHYLYPDWSETQVIYAESRLINNIPIIDTLIFVNKVLSKICRIYNRTNSKSKHKKKG